MMRVTYTALNFPDNSRDWSFFAPASLCDISWTQTRALQMPQTP